MYICRISKYTYHICIYTFINTCITCLFMKEFKGEFAVQKAKEPKTALTREQKGMFAASIATH